MSGTAWPIAEPGPSEPFLTPAPPRPMPSGISRLLASEIQRSKAKRHFALVLRPSASAAFNQRREYPPREELTAAHSCLHETRMGDHDSARALHLSVWRYPGPTPWRTNATDIPSNDTRANQEPSWHRLGPLALVQQPRLQAPL